MDHIRAPPASIMTTVCSGSLPVTDMLTYAAFSVVFAIVTIAVPHMAASIAGGTIGLALNHAFEAAFIARTVIRPIASALQTGLSKISQIGNGKPTSEATGWIKAMDFGRQTQQLSNTGPVSGPYVPAPKDPRGTSVMPLRAPATSPMGAGAGPSVNTSPLTGNKATNKI